MPTKLPLSANYNNLDNSDVPISDTIYTVVLGNSNTALAVPKSSDLGGTNTASVNYLVARIRHTPNNDVWFAINATAIVPSGSGAFALNPSELLDNNVCEYKVKSGDTLNFLTAGMDVNVSVAFYWQT